jgi:CBS domain-containing protein
MMNDEVRQIMTTNPEVVSPNDRIDAVTEMMIEKGLQQLPVTEDGKLVGMITTFDMWRHARDVQPSKGLYIKDIMSTRIIKITPKDKVGTAAELFMDKRFKTLPVVNLRNELKGVVTAFDVLKQILQEEYPRPILYQEVFQPAAE